MDIDEQVARFDTLKRIEFPDISVDSETIRRSEEIVNRANRFVVVNYGFEKGTVNIVGGRPTYPLNFFLKAGGYMTERRKRAERHIAQARATMNNSEFEAHYANKTVDQVADELEPLQRVTLTSIQGGEKANSLHELRPQFFDTDIIWNTEGGAKLGLNEVVGECVVTNVGQIQDIEYSHKCTCPLDILMHKGCQCKGV